MMEQLGWNIPLGQEAILKIYLYNLRFGHMHSIVHVIITMSKF